MGQVTQKKRRSRPSYSELRNQAERARKDLDNFKNGGIKKLEDEIKEQKSENTTLQMYLTTQRAANEKLQNMTKDLRREINELRTKVKEARNEIEVVREETEKETIKKTASFWEQKFKQETERADNAEAQINVAQQNLANFIKGAESKFNERSAELRDANARLGARMALLRDSGIVPDWFRRRYDRAIKEIIPKDRDQKLDELVKSLFLWAKGNSDRLPNMTPDSFACLLRVFVDYATSNEVFTIDQILADVADELGDQTPNAVFLRYEIYRMWSSGAVGLVNVAFQEDRLATDDSDSPVLGLPVNGTLVFLPRSETIDHGKLRNLLKQVIETSKEGEADVHNKET